MERRGVAPMRVGGAEVRKNGYDMRSDLTS